MGTHSLFRTPRMRPPPRGVGNGLSSGPDRQALSRLLSCHFSTRLPSMLAPDQSRQENLRSAVSQAA
ncbi:hypothetical protein FQZ97_745810 [compost metagenome]